jgi:hypothetical protein
LTKGQVAIDIAVFRTGNGLSQGFIPNVLRKAFTDLSTAKPIYLAKANGQRYDNGRTTKMDNREQSHLHRNREAQQEDPFTGLPTEYPNYFCHESRECCKGAYRNGYVIGHAHAVIERCETEILGQGEAADKAHVRADGDNPMRSVQRGISPGIRSSTETPSHHG